MKQTILCFALVATGFLMPKLYAQTEKDSVQYDAVTGKKLSKWDIEDKEYYEKRKKGNLEALQAEKQNITETEKYELKKFIEIVDSRLDKGEITAEKAKALKEEAAKKAAQNIDNKIAIINNQIELLNRDVTYNYHTPSGGYIGIGLGNPQDDRGSFLLGFEYKAPDKKPKYDKRTYTNMVYAFGYGNMAGDPYKFWKSGYAEIGFTFRTRMLKNSNAVRMLYGVSYQANMFTFNDNQYLVNNGGHNDLEAFPVHLKKNSYLRVDKIVAPFFFEFGPSTKKEYKDYFRYNTADAFKVGVGGFAGATVSTMQALRYKEDSRTVNIKRRADYNASTFVYGLNAYVGFGSLSFFARYELNSIFKNGDVKSNALNFGLRVDL